MSERTFSAMGCEVVVSGAGRRAFESIVALFEEREATFSRFRPSSELARVNAAPGSAVSVSPTFAAALRAAIGAARSTGGLVDPTVGAAIEAIGYDADFHQLAPDPRPVETAPRSDWRRILIGAGVLVRPAGTVIDLNGVVKSMTVDGAAALLDGPGFVSAGGDIAARGLPLAVALPSGGTVTLESGGIATSGSATRRWLRGGRLRHHLIDPRTGLSSESPWTHVTAVGRDCLSADVAAKAGFLLGGDGPAWLDERGVAARFVAADTVVENGRWRRSVDREPAWA